MKSSITTSTDTTAVVDTGEFSAVYQQRFAVQYDYPVHFTRRLFACDNPVLADSLTRLEPERRQRLVVFIDSGVAAAWPRLAEDIGAYAGHHAARLQLLVEPEIIPGGEQAKNDPALVSTLQQRLLDLGIDRQSCVVAVGGGAVLDMLGYVAATTHRGIRHVRVPTTVLAQNDSGVGVKNGINAFGVKNLLGCFAPPFAVLNDIDFLDTLEPRDRRAGIAEAVKVALIRDATFFDWLETQVDALCAGDPESMTRMIRRCAELHMRQITQGGDPFETGSARPLDYGHWSAHKLESLSDHQLRHGEAVAIGMALDSRYAAQIGMLGAGLDERIIRVLSGLGFDLWHPVMDRHDGEGRSLLLKGLAEFREHLGGELSVTLLRDIGHSEEVHDMDEAEILLALDWLRHRESSQ